MEPPRGAATAALVELAAHPLYRRDSARTIAAALAGLDDKAARFACRVLVALDSRAAVPGLVQALGGRRPRVAEAAWLALKAITGEERPPAIRAWRDLAPD